MRSTILAAVLLAGLAQASLHASIVPLSQERTTTAVATATQPGEDVQVTQAEQAQDFALFDSAVQAHAYGDWAEGHVGTWQRSEIGWSSLLAEGSAQGWGYAYPGAFESGLGHGTSRYVVTFTLTEAADFVLFGSLSHHNEFSRASVSLRDDSSEIVGYQTAPISTTETIEIDDAGSLAEGSYTLEVEADALGYGNSALQENGSAAFTITFQLAGLGPGGEVPDGDDVWPGQPLVVSRLADGAVHLAWGASCRADDADYAVYEGRIGDPSTLAPVTCSTAGLGTHDFHPVHAAAYFLVVPTDGATEGSYGDTADDTEREPSPLACFPQSLGQPICPR